MKLPEPPEVVEARVSRKAASPAPEAEAVALRAEISRTREEVREAWGQVQAAMRGRMDVRERVREDPMMFVGLAFCFGLLMGLRAGPER